MQQLQIPGSGLVYVCSILSEYLNPLALVGASCMWQFCWPVASPSCQYLFVDHVTFAASVTTFAGWKQCSTGGSGRHSWGN